MVISIISTIPFSTILGFVKKSYFASVAAVAAATAAATTQRRSPNLYLEPFRETQYIIEKRRGYETVNVAVGFRVCNMFSPDKNRLNFVKYILVGPVRSRFVRILRDENGLTYKTSINIDYYEHAGDFTIYTQVDSNKLVKNSTNRGKGLLPILFRILHDIYQNGITADEFKTAKGYLKGILARNLEDNNTLAEHNGKSVLFYNENDVYSYSKKYEVCYKDITREEINAVIRKYFIAENMCVYMNGEGLPSLNTIKRIVETAGFIPLNN
jgi:predicted Zn-dependent peptidase